MHPIQKEIGEWNIATFADRTNVEAMKNHLARELAELLSAKNFENHIEECADMAILLFGIAYRDGFDLLEEVNKKMQINKNRIWGNADCDGVISHLKGM
jgi:hypothetical protein